jgi:FKBP-type peptidyl-prolyl cis-trans isomerase
MRFRLNISLLFLILSSMTVYLPGQDTLRPAAPTNGQAQGTAGTPPQTGSDPVSYAIGRSVGIQLTRDGFQAGDFKPQDFLNGVRDGMTGVSAMTEEQFAAVMRQIDQVLQQRANAQQAEINKMLQALAGPNLAKSKKFLEENRLKPGVQTLPSGLQYSVLKSGSGATPQATDVVMVHYTGKNVDGKTFDSSIGREPAKFVVSKVVPGWVEGLQKMKVGDKWMLFIPPELAYGETGIAQLGPDGAPIIGPNEALIFEIELLNIVAP